MRRIAAIILAAFIATAAVAADERYIVVLRPGITDIPDAVFAERGGKILRKWTERRVVDLPKGIAKQIAKLDGVLFLQRVWRGEPGSDLADFRTSLRAETSATETPLPGGFLEWSSGEYLYDGSGNIKRIGSDTYTYDLLSRLYTATINGVRETYAYDSFGNLTQKTTQGSPVVLPSVDASSNRVSGFTYDVAGNVISDGTAVFLNSGETPYIWDPLNMLVLEKTVLGQEKRFIYTADDERFGIEVLDNGLLDPYPPGRWTVRDFDGKVLREFEGDADSPWGMLEDYVYRDGQLASGSTWPDWGGQRQFHLDHLGTVRAITNNFAYRVAAHDYYPFGVEQTFHAQEVMDAGLPRPEPMAFAGHQRDYHGVYNVANADYLDYMHARYYNPQLGRFLSVDPSLDIDKATHSPQMWNRYAYVQNNPLRYTDPNGRDARDFFNAIGPAASATGGDLVQFGREAIHYDQVAEAFRGFGSAPANERAMAVAVGIIAIADVGANALQPEKGALEQGATKAGAIVLGHFPGNKAVAEKMGAEFLNITNWTFGRNRGWLRDALTAGKDIFLSVDPTKVRPGSTTEKELKYLAKRGWEFVYDDASGLWKAARAAK